MAYQPYSAVNPLYNLKGQWTTANNNGDEAKKNEVAQKAQSYYDELRRNGYGDVADEMQQADYTTAKSINDKWAKMGKTETRPYFYSLGKAYNMSEKDVDALIGWDATTGEVTFGGKKIGRPDALVDGASYWSDTSVLDNAWNDYTKRSGTTVNNGVNNPAYSQSMDSATRKNNDYWEKIKSDASDVQGKYDDLFGYANSDVTQSAEYKSAFDNVMPSYNLAAMQGRDNEVASGGASNGGNIDSYAAANAMRQQAALTAKGQALAHQIGLEAYNARVQNAKSILSDLGGYNQGVYAAMDNNINNDVNIANTYFNNAETAKNNQVSRDVATAEVTGVVPTSMIYTQPYYSQFFNEDGTLKNEDIDYKAEIDKAVAAGNNDLAQALRAARGVKIYSDFSKYGQHAADGDYTLPGAQKTETARQFDEQIAQADRAMDIEQSENEANREHELNMRTTSSQNSAGNIGTKTSSQKTGNPEPLMSEKEVTEWVDALNKSVSDTYGEAYKALKQTSKNKYERADIDADYIIIRVLEADDLTLEQKEYLLYDKFGITPDQVNAARKDPHYSPVRSQGIPLREPQKNT